MITKRALVCAPLLPEYDRESGGQSIFDLVLYLREAGWAVSYAAENGNTPGADRYVRILQQRGVTTFRGFNGRMRDLIASECLDLVVCAFWYIAEKIMPVVRQVSPATRVAVNTMDLHFLRNARRLLARGVNSPASEGLDATYGSELIRELNTYAAADAAFTVSAKEAGLLNDFVGNPDLARVVTDNEELPLSDVPFEARRGILFLGNFRHPPNTEAAEFLCKDVLPQLDSAITAEHPVYIVGNAADKIRYLARSVPNVHVVGWVPSVVPYLHRTRLSVVPLLHGAGTKRKMLQALMAGAPTVSTTVGVEGLDLRDEEHVLIADEPKRFAQSIRRLLDDVDLCDRLSRQGRAFVAPVYSREAVSTRFLKIVNDVLRKAPKLALRDETTDGMNGSVSDPRRYRRLVDRIRKAAADNVPPGAVVAVISKGDQRLLKLDGCRAWHFPQDSNGTYAGHYPADSSEAIAKVEELKGRGAQYLLVPITSAWWLEHYSGLREHLTRHYREILRDETTCVLFSLRSDSPDG
jgi:glycosyltransferase involved in cell wall biosynthesis